MRKLLAFFLILMCLAFMPVTALAATKTYNISSTKKITIDEGKKAKFSLPSKYKNIKWTSSNKKVATISKYGTITAVNGGKATITAKSGSISFKCYVAVKEDYSEWVLYDTDDLETLLNNIIDGYVVEIDDQWYCSPEYFEMISNAEVVYEKDISDGKEYNRGNILTPDTEFIIIEDDGKNDSAEAEALQKRIQDMIKNGKATSE